MDAITAIHTRRSVRAFADRAVPRDLIAELIADAAHAPFTPVATEGAWHFTVIRGRERLAAMGARAELRARAPAAAARLGMDRASRRLGVPRRPRGGGDLRAARAVGRARGLHPLRAAARHRRQRARDRGGQPAPAKVGLAARLAT